MKTQIQTLTMPKWGIEMEEGIIREWLAEEGKQVKQGDIIAVIETEKIANDVELEFSGLLRRRLADVEQPYPVGALLAVFADENISDAELDAFIADFKPPDAGFSHGAADDTQTDTQAANIDDKPADKTGSPAHINISPKAKSLAAQAGLDIDKLTGTGRNGRISLQDVEQAIKAQGQSGQAEAKAQAEEQGSAEKKAPPAQAMDDNPYQSLPLSAMRRTIAKRLSHALEIPHFYLRCKVNLDALMDLRAAQKAENITPPTINDYLIKACANGLMATPAVNAHFKGDALHQFAHADIAVAVSVSGGLILPIIKKAEDKSVADIATEMRDLAARAKAGKLSPDEYQGGTFSLSNLGMYGVTGFDAVINPPMVAILAVGAAQRVPCEQKEGGVMFINQMEICLSCDHRAIDGAVGGEFLNVVKAALESPQTL